MRILIIPASRYGGTAEIGRAMATALRKEGFGVDVSQPQHMFDLSPYAAHIIGSGLYMGRWLDEASKFVDEYGQALQQKPTWLFSSGPLGDAKPSEPIQPELLEHLMTASGAREHRLFSGRLESKRLSRTERFVAKWVGAEDGDHREWADIDHWVHHIAEQLPRGERVIDGMGRASRPGF